jgi:hypothetical protein
MKFSLTTVLFFITSPCTTVAFAPVQTFTQYGYRQTSTRHSMAMDTPPAPPVETSSVVVVQPNQYGQPSSVRYSDFIKLVNGDKIEKVTFSSDGTQLLGVDADGNRIKIEALPNDPDLLTQLTSHKVSNTIWWNRRPDMDCCKNIMKRYIAKADEYFVSLVK